MPGLIWGKDEYARPDRTQAGMLFYNDEGGENGGLIFSGKMVDGQPTSGGSLTSDRYHQDQVVQLLGVQESQQRFAGVFVNDQPEQAQDFAAIGHIAVMPEGPAKDAAYRNANVGQIPRAFLGRDRDRSSKLILRDGQGRQRLVLKVAESGHPVIQFLDTAGNVVRTVE